MKNEIIKAISCLVGSNCLVSTPEIFYIGKDGWVGNAPSNIKRIEALEGWKESWQPAIEAAIQQNSLDIINNTADIVIANQEIHNNKENISKADTNIKELQGKNESLEMAVINLQASSEEHNERLGSLENWKTKTDTWKTGTDTDIDTLQNTISVLSDTVGEELPRITEETTKLTASVKTLQDTSSSTEDQISEINVKISNLNNGINTANQWISSTGQQVVNTKKLEIYESAVISDDFIRQNKGKELYIFSYDEFVGKMIIWDNEYINTTGKVAIETLNIIPSSAPNNDLYYGNPQTGYFII